MFGYFPAPKLMGAISATAVIFAAMYLLTMYQKLMFGPLDKPENKAVRDIHGRETWVFGIVVAAALVMGLLPQPILDRSEKSVDAFVASYRERLARLEAQPGRARPRLPGAAGRGAGRRRRARRSRSRSGGSRAMTFDVNQLFAYSPMLILIGMGCVILLAETFIQGKAPLGAGLAGRRRLRGGAGGDRRLLGRGRRRRARTSTGCCTVDRMALYLDAAFVVAALLTLLFAPPLPARAGLRVRRVLRPGAVRHRRHGDGRARDQPGVAAHRHRDDVAGRLRPHRLLAPQPAQRRGGDEVLPHGRLRHRLPGLRHRAGLRRHGRRVHLRGHRRQDGGAPARCRSSSSASTSS